MRGKKKTAVLYHIFYEDTIEHIAAELENLSWPGILFFFNICSDIPNQLSIKQKLTEYFPGSCITISSNKGKDIGGKLLLLSICMQYDITPDWFIFLHDKKSLQALNSKTWKNDLLTIIDKENIGKIESIIEENPLCGIIAAEGYVQKEPIGDGQTGRNKEQLLQLLKEYNIALKQYEFVAGTMFWIKALPLIDFFRKNNPMKIRATLESGNVLDNFKGTYTHSWERMLSWIVLSEGLNIKTV